ncbi:unnamed protein product [Spirodela intermedia]|uniref:Uncharacterized protein n=1 Tax=Spirodela intermedia TaxID=51605 RepID=A0A7I8I9M5_SPIIN|nr:unnamed protein product [Spirodela intermedia]CAA6654365.1 unnamed protein product [Spirodela intermedia]
MRSLKRLASDEAEEDDDWLVNESNRRRPVPNAVQEAMIFDATKGLLLELEPFFRRVVREELQKQLSRYACSASRPPLNQIQASSATASRWRLTFRGELPGTLFTSGKIEARDSTAVKIVVEDLSSGSVVTSGPLSSVRVEIVVLDGDFCSDEREEWTEKEFADRMVREREGKRPLLTGDLAVTLRGGAAALGSLVFTDNSSWIRSRKFRLGARISPNSNLSGQRIQEAVSGAFSVKDHRGELYKKHHPPSLDDEVWRLEKIGKHGVFHRRLSENGINKVQDFLRSLVIDRDWLRGVLGSGMSNKIWEATVEHAQECCLDGKLYSYYVSDGGVMLVFDSIFRLVGAKFNGGDYQELGAVDAPQRALVNRLKQLAYENREEIMEIGLLPFDVISRRLALEGDASRPPPAITLQTTPSTMETQFADGLVVIKLVDFLPRRPHGGEASVGSGSSVDYEAEPSTSGETFFSYDWDMGTCFSQPLGWDTVGQSFQSSLVAASEPPAPESSVRIASSRWVMLLAALKCWMFIRRRVAARRMARLYALRGLSGLPGTFPM